MTIARDVATKGCVPFEQPHSHFGTFVPPHLT